jgi:hypothetical protein
LSRPFNHWASRNEDIWACFLIGKREPNRKNANPLVEQKVRFPDFSPSFKGGVCQGERPLTYSGGTAPDILRGTAPDGSADIVAERRIEDWLIGVPSPPAMYVKDMVDGLSRKGTGDVSEKESQVRPKGNMVHPNGLDLTSPQQVALTTTRPPCFEVEKYALRLCDVTESV